MDAVIHSLCVEGLCEPCFQRVIFLMITTFNPSLDGGDTAFLTNLSGVHQPVDRCRNPIPFVLPASRHARVLCGVCR